MFTGIVTDIGTLTLQQADGSGARLLVTCRMAREGLVPGESVSVSGVCLTVEVCHESAFQVTASPETLRRTSLGRAVNGRRVNLERALRAGDLMGGHLVQGHVDGVSQVRSVQAEGVSRVLSLSAPDEVLPHLVDRGSICVDGVSLTVTGLDARGFQVTLIPATLEQTTLDALAPGDDVNVEADIVSKYLARHVSALQVGKAAERPSDWLAGSED